MTTFPLRSTQPFHQLTEWFDDTELVAALSECIEAQKRAAADARAQFQPNPDADQAVSAEALESILATGDDIHGISRQREISNVIAFNCSHVADSVNSDEVVALRQKADRLVTDKLRATIESNRPLSITCSGHFWYPPGAYMGWHTNNGAPGWRVYLTHSAQPGESFFRYREPDTGRIITSHDNAWDVRLFRIDPKVSLWHAVYSQTDRFSLGYMVHVKPWWKKLTRALRG
jgi:hypothetical protein